MVVLSIHFNYLKQKYPENLFLYHSYLLYQSSLDNRKEIVYLFSPRFPSCMHEKWESYFLNSCGNDDCRDTEYCVI